MIDTGDNKPDFFDTEMYYKEVNAAAEVAKEKGYFFRIIKQDGEYLPRLANAVEERINVSVDNGLVTGFEGMG